MNFLERVTKAFRPTARPIVQSGGTGGIVREAFTGAWQRNVEYTIDSVLSNPTLFRLSLIHI